jgi:hypothetical protein
VWDLVLWYFWRRGFGSHENVICRLMERVVLLRKLGDWMVHFIFTLIREVKMSHFHTLFCLTFSYVGVSYAQLIPAECHCIFWLVCLQ